MKDVGRQALLTKLSSRLNIYHDVASALDPRVGEPANEEDCQKIVEKIEYIHRRLSGNDSEPTVENEGTEADVVK